MSYLKSCEMKNRMSCRSYEPCEELPDELPDEL